jgi:hypothetical protein
LVSSIAGIVTVTFQVGRIATTGFANSVQNWTKKTLLSSFATRSFIVFFNSCLLYQAGEPLEVTYLQ